MDALNTVKVKDLVDLIKYNSLNGYSQKSSRNGGPVVQLHSAASQYVKSHLTSKAHVTDVAMPVRAVCKTSLS